MKKEILHITHLDAETLLGKINFIKTELYEIKQQINPTKKIECVSVNDTAKFYGVSRPTINDWTSKGILTAYRTGNRVYYKRHELEAALVQINNRTTNGK